MNKSDDPLFPAALDVARNQCRVVIASLQRRLKIGYHRAAVLFDALVEAGAITPRDEDGRGGESLCCEDGPDQYCLKKGEHMFNFPTPSLVAGAGNGTWEGYYLLTADNCLVHTLNESSPEKPPTEFEPFKAGDIFFLCEAGTIAAVGESVGPLVRPWPGSLSEAVNLYSIKLGAFRMISPAISRGEFHEIVGERYDLTLPFLGLDRQAGADLLSFIECNGRV